jgi:NADPH-dependent 2,4-dienoyl-CoA reductase/sulfur reductase-like enzyme/nitrite reductase/ring-hydroxylating ferredoxin subunit
LSEGPSELSGPDLVHGVALANVADGTMLLGHVQGESVLLARRGDELFAIGAKCTHYGGPLADGLLVDDTVRCPWHHACFSLRTGEALRAPALNPVPCWRVEHREGTVYVGAKLERPQRQTSRSGTELPRSIVIIGGGAAGNAAAEALSREGYSGRVTMVSTDETVPYDRPNLSKDYLAGNAPEEWIPLRSPAFYDKHGIDLKLRASVAAIDTKARQVQLEDGSQIDYDRLLLATGAEPVRLGIPGAELSHVHYLRTLADSRALIAKAKASHRAVVIGASFIGLEVAASLRARGIEVRVVAPETRPMERIMGAEIGDLVRAIHEEHGVVFHLGTTAAEIGENSVTLKSGEKLQADLIVVGIGVRPATALAERAGLAIDRGIMVNDYLETGVPGIFAAGDIARWPARLTGDRIRVEHWVVAERQGQTVARNMLGAREHFDAVPFFWSQHYDLMISYVGYAERWDKIEIDGRIEARDCTATYWRGDQRLAVVTISRDIESLRAEVELEQMIAGSR